jgi:hypothetical protein
MLAALAPAAASAAGAPERPAKGPAPMHICISRCAAATRHPTRGKISRKRETTKTRKPETKCRRATDPEPRLMHSLHDSKRPRPGPIGVETATPPCAAVRAAALPARQSGSTPGLSASVGDKALAFLELRGAPGLRNPASAHHLSQRGVAGCRGAHPRPPARPVSR